MKENQVREHLSQLSIFKSLEPNGTHSRVLTWLVSLWEHSQSSLEGQSHWASSWGLEESKCHFCLQEGQEGASGEPEVVSLSSVLRKIMDQIYLETVLRQDGNRTNQCMKDVYLLEWVHLGPQRLLRSGTSFMRGKTEGLFSLEKEQQTQGDLINMFKYLMGESEQNYSQWHSGSEAMGSNWNTDFVWTSENSYCDGNWHKDAMEFSSLEIVKNHLNTAPITWCRGPSSELWEGRLNREISSGPFQCQTFWMSEFSI